MRNYKCDPLLMGQRLKDLRRNVKNSMSQLAFAEEIRTCLGMETEMKIAVPVNYAYFTKLKTAPLCLSIERFMYENS
ncbi:MAG: hypothetical protein J6A92_08000 [Lachnospiraceae bacterium]|nr:hypothetical protein [Lachnospiraceae bacterium]